MSCQKRSSRETKIIQKVIETFKNTLVTLPGWKVNQKKFPGIKRRIQRKKKEANYFKRTPLLSSQFSPRLKLWILGLRGPTRNQVEWMNLDPCESTTPWNFLKFQHINKGKDPLKLITYKETKMRKALDFEIKIQWRDFCSQVKWCDRSWVCLLAPNNWKVRYHI